MSTKLSQKLERINASMARIREKTNLPNAVIEDVATAVEQLGTSGGETVKTNIYKVATIADRDAITDIVEGDMCVVHTSSMANMQATDSVTAITFPATVVLPSAFTGSAWVSLRDADYTSDIMLDLSQTRMRCDIMGNDYISISYTSTDGITYTRTDSNAETIEFSSPVRCEYQEEWNDTLGYFLQVGGVEFGGLFEYTEGAWDYVNIGSSVSASQIFKSKTAYTSDGMLSGTMGVNMSNADIKQLNKLIAEGIERNSTDSIYQLPQLIGAQIETNGTLYFPLLEWLDVSKLTTFREMFYNVAAVKKLDLSKWNTSNVTNMYGTFNRAQNLTELNLDNWDTGKVTDMRSMFSATKVASLDLSHFNTSNVTDMGYMFQSCGALTNLNLANWNTKKVTNMTTMFKHCTVIEELDLSSFDTSNVTNMQEMFFCCYKLAKLDIRNFDFSKVTNYTKAFGGDSTSFPADCLVIVKDATAKSWITSKFTWLTNVKTVAEYGG